MVCWADVRFCMVLWGTVNVLGLSATTFPGIVLRLAGGFGP